MSALCFGLLTGCGTQSGWLSSAGPSTEQVNSVAKIQADGRANAIKVVDVTELVARQVKASQRRALFSESWGQTRSPGLVVGAGDVLEVSVWEAPPASLFGTAVLDPRAGSSAARLTAFPEQMVNAAGTINVPFAGAVPAAGRLPQDIEADITQRLKGKANQPQVMVRVTRNATSNVTVVGEVAQSLRMPLTAKGERLLDALAAAGGVRQPVAKMSLQITRGSQVLSLPLDTIIADPLQNIALHPGDVVTAVHQPFSLTALGATGRNEELNFESQGITLAQALGRLGGLQDARADARGVFVFRFEDAAALSATGAIAAGQAQGKLPVVYRVDLKDPAMFFVAQDFPMRHKDVVYVSNAPAAELQKFLNIVGSVAGPILTLRAVTN
ncbi:polysaccharide biosynthesis/export family protein [Limnohabitans sp. WS1]|uniref:polysaccharide biosynthesis/export family protein n=1 Tax=Limnohabitans sp. WS1 TaxID=1100726 RepID=UPI001E5B305A|nr:polysaccharide biosynthesis/export family protein [Limnohabitans sp. WS1]